MNSNTSKMFSKKTMFVLAATLLAPCAGFAANDESYSQSLRDWETSLAASRAKRTAPAKPVPAQESSWDDDYSDTNESAYVTTNSDKPAFKISVGVDAFYASACDELVKRKDNPFYDKAIDGIDLYGGNLRVGIEFPELFGTSLITPEFFVVAGYGYGDESYSESEYYSGGWWSDKYDYTSTMFHVALGAAVRFALIENLELSLNARIGFCNSKLKYENEYSDYYADEYYYESESESESDTGLLYGIGAGIAWTFAENHRISLNVDYIGTTAQPEFDYYEKTYEGFEKRTLEVEKQSYVFFSAGYQFVF